MECLHVCKLEEIKIEKKSRTWANVHVSSIARMTVRNCHRANIKILRLCLMEDVLVVL